MNKFGRLFVVVGMLFAVGGWLFAAGTQAQGADEPDEVVTITWHEGNADAYFVEAVREELNIELVADGIPWRDREQTNLMLSAGEMPEAGAMRGGASVNPIALWEDGLIRGIPIEMIREHAPNLSDVYDRYELSWVANRNPDNADELLGIGSARPAIALPLTGYPALRVDWLRNVGMDLPEYEENKIPLDANGEIFFLDYDMTIDEFEEILIAFRDGDADGDGETGDTIPFGAYDKTDWAFGALMGAYGISYGDNQYVDGRLYDYRIHPNLPAFLSRMNEWYEAGLIDSEYLSTDRGGHWEKVEAGLIAAASINLSYVERMPDRTPNNWIPDAEVGTGAEVVVLPPPVGPNGDQGLFQFRELTVGGNPCYVRADVSDAKLAKILEVLDYKFTLEGFVHSYFGEPGGNFEWAGEPWDSTALVRDGMQRDEFAIRPFALQEEHLPFIYPRLYLDFLLAEVQPRQKDWGMRAAHVDVFQEHGVAEIEADVGATLQTMFDEFFHRAVAGRIDPKTEWEDYVSQWRANGGSQLLEALAESPLLDELESE